MYRKNTIKKCSRGAQRWGQVPDQCERSHPPPGGGGSIPRPLVRRLLPGPRSRRAVRRRGAGVGLRLRGHEYGAVPGSATMGGNIVGFFSYRYCFFL